MENPSDPPIPTNPSQHPVSRRPSRRSHRWMENDGRGEETNARTPPKFHVDQLTTDFAFPLAKEANLCRLRKVKDGDEYGRNATWNYHPSRRN